MDQARSSSEHSKSLEKEFVIDVDGILYVAQAIAAFDPNSAESGEERKGCQEARAAFEREARQFGAIELCQSATTRAFSGQRTWVGKFAPR